LNVYVFVYILYSPVIEIKAGTGSIPKNKRVATNGKHYKNITPGIITNILKKLLAQDSPKHFVYSSFQTFIIPVTRRVKGYTRFVESI